MEAMGGLVMTFLLNAAWQTPLVAVVATGCTYLTRGIPARHLHHLWTMTLGLSVALPLLSLRTVLTVDGGPGVTNASAMTSADLSLSAAEAQPLSTGFVPVGAIEFPPLLLYVAVACYVAFLVGRTARLWWGWHHMNVVRQEAVERDLEPIMRSIGDRCRRTLGLNGVSILCSSDVAGPMTLGAIRPVVVLPPQAFVATSPDLLSSILGHEMAHVRRRDFVRNLAIEVLYTPIAFHPVARWIKNRIDTTRELACDELVTDSLVARGAYARSLVTVARSMHDGGRQGLALGILEAGSLEQRVHRLLRPRPHVRTRVARAALAAAAAAMVLAGTLASAFSVSASQVLTVADAERQLVGTWRARWEDVLVPKFTATTDSSPIWLQFRVEGGRVVGTAWHDAIDLIDQAGTDVKILQVFPRSATAPLQDVITTGNTVSFTQLHHGAVVEYQLEILNGPRAVLRLKDPRAPDGGQQFREWLTLTRQ